MEEVIWNSSSCPRLCVHKAYNFLKTFMWSRPGQLGLDPFNQNSNRSDREKWSTSKGGPVFSKLFRLDRTDTLSFGPKFPEILVEWITPLVLFIPTSPSCSELFHRSFIERFSNYFLPITRGANVAVNQSEFWSFTYNSSCSKCGKNRTYKVRLLLVIGWKTGARFLSQSRSVATTIALSLSTGIWKLF